MAEIEALYENKEYTDEDEKKSVIKQVKIILHDLEKDEVRRLDN